MLEVELCVRKYNRTTKVHVAKHHLSKVKLERGRQRPSPTSVCDLRGGPRGIVGLIVCPSTSVALHCSFAC
ncbi:unnamed protein product [Porites evermanni]|uniref:Uncharacterized protein n=1 Tax=Porites evermanni TaxID=104178 RepID=A0ABN8M4I3_9CNID|nr:unnamed protein product [Porites evermanni]